MNPCSCGSCTRLKVLSVNPLKTAHRPRFLANAFSPKLGLVAPCCNPVHSVVFRCRARDMSEEFERAKSCFEQNSEHIRSLNQIMWQIPLLAMTLTGGLWYAVATTPDLPRSAQNGLLILAGAADLALVLVLARIRFVMEGYIEKAKGFYEAGHPNTSHWLLRRGLVVTVFSFLLTISGAGSLYAVSTLGAAIPSNCGASGTQE